MSAMKTIEFRFQRTVPAPRGDVFDAWLDPQVPGNPWNAAEKLILNPQTDGLFFWAMRGISHYGRFTEVERPVRIRHTWVSPNTLGLESTVTVTFEKTGQATVLTLVHSGLPDDERARSHEKGWNYFLDLFHQQFDGKKRENK